MRWHDGDGQSTLLSGLVCVCVLTDYPKKNSLSLGEDRMGVGWENRVSRRLLPKMFSSQEEAILAIKKELEKEVGTGKAQYIESV